MIALDYYKLNDQPFGVTPDSRFLFLTRTHKETLTTMVQAIDAGCGFLALTAVPGAGKTTLLHEVLRSFRDRARSVILFHTISSPVDLLKAVLSGLGERQLSGSLVDLQIRLKELLVQQNRLGKRVILVIDEAQNLEAPALELVRMLSNFETERDKLIQIILAGQPQLEEKIGSPELLQLRQRISLFARLRSFTPDETTQYILHRLRVAGYHADMPLFTKDALTLVALCSEGIPRNINNLCFSALVLGFALQQKSVDRDIMRQVIGDLDVGPWRRSVALLARPQEESLPKFETVSTGNRVRGWLPVVSVVLGAALVVEASILLGIPRMVLRASREAEAPAVPSLITPPAQKAEPVEGASDPALAHATEETLKIAPVPRQGADGAPLSVLAASVKVEPGQTLLRICANRFGSCSTALMRCIQEMNPSLTRFDHIETGQRILMPATATIPKPPCLAPGLYP